MSAPRYWAVLHQFAAEMKEVAPALIEGMRAGMSGKVVGIPVYWSAGHGVWPNPCEGCLILKEMKPEDI